MSRQSTARPRIEILSPFLQIVALAVLVAMGRSMLFLQERAGRRGRRSRFVRLLTRVLETEAKQDSLGAQNVMSGPVSKERHDPRVTRLGHLMRITGIGELLRPLLWREQQEILGWHRRGAR